MPSSNRESQPSFIHTATQTAKQARRDPVRRSANRTESAPSGDKISDSFRLLRPNPANLRQQALVGCDDTLDRSAMDQEAIRQCRTDARQPLKHVEFLRCEAFWFPVVSLENLRTGSRQLAGEQSQNTERPSGLREQITGSRHITANENIAPFSAWA